MRILETERDQDAFIITPTRNLGEFQYQQLDQEFAEVAQAVEDPGVKQVLFDFENTDYFESTALSFFVRIWSKLKRRQARMGFCNLSEHEREILQVSQLDSLWPIYSSREEALQALRQTPSPSENRSEDGGED